MNPHLSLLLLGATDLYHKGTKSQNEFGECFDLFHPCCSVADLLLDHKPQRTW